VTRLHTGRFVEDGGAAALIGASRTYEVGATTLGIRGQARLANSPFIVKGLLGWQHAFGDVEPHALMAFQDGTAAFSVTGAPIDRNALVAEAGLDWQATGDVSLSVSYRSQIGTHVQSHGLTGSFVLQF